MTSDGNRVTIDGAEIERRLDELGVSTAQLAKAAGFKGPRVVQNAINNDASGKTMTKLWQTLDDIESGKMPHPGSDPREQIAGSFIEGMGARDNVEVRVYPDGTRALFLVPPGGHRPADRDIEEVRRSLDDD